MATDLQPYTSCLDEKDPTSQLHPRVSLLLVTPPDVSSRMIGWDRQTHFGDSFWDFLILDCHLSGVVDYTTC